MTEDDRELQRARSARDGYAVVVGESNQPIETITLNGVRYVRADSALAPGPATEEMLAWARGLIEEVRDGCGPVAGVRVFGKLKVFVRVTDVP